MHPKAYLREQASCFSCEDIIALVRGDILAIRISSFASREACETLSQNILASTHLEYYPHAPAIGKIFNAFYEGHSDHRKREHYYSEVGTITNRLKAMSWPFLNPLEQLRLELHDVWEAGAQRENIHGRPMSFGLGQVFKEESCALPHMDFLRMDEPSCAAAQTLLTQLTALIYIQPAEEGGELELWREHYDHQEFMERKNAATYGLDYAKVPPPSLTVVPRLGDLVIADSTRVHAVKTVTRGVRVALNCFIGFRGINQPLTYWS